MPMFKCRIEIVDEIEAASEDEARDGMEESIKFCENWLPDEIEVTEVRKS